MPRNPDGTYDLPAGNPVVSGTTIDADNWANPTMGDIGAVLADSLSRTGKGGMQAPLKLFDGSLALPGLAFDNDTDTGLRRVAENIMTLVAGGVDVLSIAETGLSLISNFIIEYTKSLDFANPAGNMDDVGAYRFINTASGLALEKRNDAGDSWVQVLLVGDNDADPIVAQLPVLLQQTLNIVGSLNAQSGGTFGGAVNLAYSVGLYLANNSEEIGADAWRVVNIGDALRFEVNTGTVGTPVWATIISLTPTTTIINNLALQAVNAEDINVLASTSNADPKGGMYFSASDTTHAKTGTGTLRLRKRNDGIARIVIEKYVGGGTPWAELFRIPLSGAGANYPQMGDGLADQTSSNSANNTLATHKYVDGFGAWTFNISGWWRLIGNGPAGFGNQAIEMVGIGTTVNGVLSVLLPITISSIRYSATCTRIDPGSSQAGNFPTNNDVQFAPHIDPTIAGTNDMVAIDFAIPRRNGVGTAPVPDGTQFCWHVVGTVPV